MAAPFLEVKALHGWYGESHVLHGVDFHVDEGEVVTLLGRNGAGRTSTLRAIMGLIGTRKGSVKIHGTETIALATHRIARLGIGYCPEERGIFASLSAEENLMLPPVLAEGGMSLDEIYALFPNLQERAGSQGTRLSGGEQQMLAVARILRTGARLLLLDEISEGLAPVIVEKLSAMVAMLRANRPLQIVALWLLANSMASTLFGKTLPYVLKYELGRADLIGPVLASLTAAAMVSIPVWAAVAKRTSKRTITLAGAAMGVTGYCAILLAPPNAGPLLFATTAWIGFGAGAGYLAFWSMVPDTVEYGQFRTGTRAEGVVFGTIAFVQKAALGISVGILGELLTLIGFVPNAVQTSATLGNMRLLLTVGPIVMLLLGITAIWFYAIDARLHARLVRVLRRRHPGDLPA